MSDSSRPPARKLAHELIVAVTLGLALLAVGVWQRSLAMGEVASDWAALARLLGLRLGDTPLGAEFLRFAAGQIALHMTCGLLTWPLARLTARAFGLGARFHLWLIVGWFASVTLWILIANATLFPWSESGFPNEAIAHPIVGEARLLEILSLGLLAFIAWMLVRVLLAIPALRRANKRLFVYGTLVAILLATFWKIDLQAEAPAQGRPNIVLLGIDSLRNDAVGVHSTIGITPNIDIFLRDGAHLFTDAITPLARTFPSWTSILSGRNPRSTAARENLVPLSTFGQLDTIGKIAQENGYRTIFATDEVRFSNIDGSFGFDQVITPTIGVADFLLGRFNDLPLPNLIANTLLGKWLFPATYSNRAAAVTYQPETFVDYLDAEVQPEGPTLLAVHLALPHHPYNWSESGDRIFSRASDYAYQYSNAVIAADRQFGQVLAALERKGMLRDALVVVLSDHGEALGLPASDSILRGAAVRELLDGHRIGLWGHGTSVLSPHQFSAVLAFRGFGSVALPGVFRADDTPVSLIDVAPTIVDVLGLKHAAKFEGVSLKRVIAGDPGAIAALDARPRFTETGFSPKSVTDGDFDERSLLGEAASLFRMNPDNGRLEMRAEAIPSLIAHKERAALNREWLLAALPSGRNPKTQKYVLVNRQGGAARRLESAPTPDDAQAYALWQALHAEFHEEVLPPEPRAPGALAAN